MEHLGRQPYMAVQPIVANIGAATRQGKDIRGERMLDSRTQETAAFKIYLAQRHVLWVIDGQHRRKGMQMIFDFLETVRGQRAPSERKPLRRKGWRPLTPEETAAWEECFEGFPGRTAPSWLKSISASRRKKNANFSTTLISSSKEFDANLALQFDNSNPINLFIKETLISKLNLRVTEFDIKNWAEDDGAIPRKDLVAVNALLFLNKTNISGATPAMMEGKSEIGHRFWTAIMALLASGSRTHENSQSRLNQ